MSSAKPMKLQKIKINYLVDTDLGSHGDPKFVDLNPSEVSDVFSSLGGVLNCESRICRYSD